MEDNFGPGNDHSYCFGSIFSSILLESTLTTSAVLAGVGAYKLQTGSVAIDAGNTSTYASVDVFGTARPQGTAPDIGAYESIEDLNEPPTVPVLTNPANGHSFWGNKASLYWQKSTDPEGGNVTYRVQVAEDANFTSNLQTFNVDGDGSLMDSRIVVSAAAMLPFLALLGWRGRNRKKQTLMLFIAAMLLTTPLFISCSSKDGGVTYSYSNGDNEKDTSDGLGALGVLTTGINNGDVDENTISFEVTGLKIMTTYYWRVIAVDDQNDTSEPSETRSFTTGLIPLPI
jgi:hypothetical protein